MKSMLWSIWNDVKHGDNIDLYITVLGSIILVILNIFGLATSLTATITLSVLALMSISSLANRRKIESILEKINEPAAKFFLDRFPHERELSLVASKDLLIIGAVLNKTIRNYYPLLEDKLKNGNKVKFLVTNPSSVVLDSIAKQQYKPTEVEELKSYLLLTLSSLEKLRSKFPEMVKIRVVDHQIQFGALAADINTTSGVIYVELYSFKMEKDAPIFALYPQNKMWFEFYSRQIESIWESGKEWSDSK